MTIQAGWRKFAIFLAFLPAAITMAGLFGAIHDQISYTVSDEYFTRFKFIQFRLLDSDTPERLKAALVGFLASWWMGLPLGLLTGMAGFIHPTSRQMKRALFWSLPLMAGFTLAFALGGLVYGYFQTTELDITAYQGWFIPKGLVHPRNFICAGYMHNAAYIGGVAAIPLTGIFHFMYRRRSALAHEAFPEKVNA